mgnify:CR=1 FL=1
MPSTVGIVSSAYTSITTSAGVGTRYNFGDGYIYHVWSPGSAGVSTTNGVVGPTQTYTNAITVSGNVTVEVLSIAGGGGGSAYITGGYNNGSGGTGGGGGGNAANSAAGVNGTNNLGGGGGATGGDSLYGINTGGSGGSGVVVIRYANTFPDAYSTTGSPTLTNTGGYKIYKWTGSGSITW